MVVQRPSKPRTRVRSPSPAPRFHFRPPVGGFACLASGNDCCFCFKTRPNRMFFIINASVLVETITRW